MRSLRPNFAAVPADVIDYLDKHSGAFTALLTFVLIAVTTYYAVQNRRMVKEMAKARELSVMPKLALEFHRLAPTAMTVAIKNVGAGPALEIDVRLIYDPLDARGSEEEQRWRQNLLAPGEQRDFLPPGDLNDNLNTLPATYRSVRLVGSMKDALGKDHAVNEMFDDLPKWRDVLGGARQRWVAADPERRLAEELAKKLEPPLKNMTNAISELRKAT